METPKITLTENLQKLIDKMQFSNCCIARDRVQFLDNLLTIVVMDEETLSLPKEQRAILIEMLAVMKTDYQSFIPEWEPKLEL